MAERWNGIPALRGNPALLPAGAVVETAPGGPLTGRQPVRASGQPHGLSGVVVGIRVNWSSHNLPALKAAGKNPML